MRTNAGIDHQAAVMSGTSAQPAAANYIALSVATRAPAAADTFLTNDGTTISELWASGGGLNRAQAVYAHTAAAPNFTLTKTFTCNASDTASPVINKAGVLNAPATVAPTTTTGTLVYENAVTSPPTLLVGDAITVTETVNI